jgi:2-polyprenyl-3-methyl-5-hydroxy-6-metoxy-1,4-benzoquinol methylase
MDQIQTLKSELKLSPIDVKDGIPVFSKSDAYVENYERISQDHIAELKKSGTNPFIPEELWLEVEKSTELLVRKYSKPGQKVLDVGVGLGRLLEKFSGLDRYGIDISFDYLKVAAAKGIKCAYSKIEDMPYADELFDVIICTDVLEHVLDLNLAIKNILRVLNKNGILIVRVPYREDLSGYLNPSYPYHFVHMRNFDENNLQLLFSRIFGCTVMEWNTAGTSQIMSRMKHEIPDIRFLRSLNYRYYQFLKRNRPEKYDALFYKSEINIVLKK